MSESIIISIIIPCFNGEKYIKRCLNAILESKFTGYEVIIIDDGSTDKSREILKKYQKYPQIKLIIQRINQGPAKARNLGANQAKGDYLFFLDVDTKIAKDCLTAIFNKFERDGRTGVLQAKLIEGKTGKVETAGHFLSFFGFPYELGIGENESQRDKETLIFGARSAAIVIRKNLFDKIGGFDEDYFIYGEDTDLSWRVWLSGFKVIFLPQAVVYHFGKSSLTKKTEWRIFYEGAKNNTNYILKNASTTMLLWMLPGHTLAWILVSLKLIFQRRPLMAVWVYKGLWWNLRNIEKTLIKRRKVRSFAMDNNQTTKIIFGPLGIRQFFLKGFKWFSQI